MPESTPVFMRRLVLLSSILLSYATAALAQAPSVRLTGSVSNPTPVNGETVWIDVTLRNDRSQPITNFSVYVLEDRGIITAAESAGSDCGPLFDSRIACTTGTLAARAEATYRVHVRLSNSAPVATFVVAAYVPGVPVESLRIPLNIVRPSAEADLEVRTESPENTPLHTPVGINTTVINSGPSTALDVLVVDELFYDFTPYTAQVDPACRVVGPRFVCRVAQLAMGEQVTFRNFASPSSFPYVLLHKARVIAELLYDPDPDDNRIEHRVNVGVPSLARVLLPIVAAEAAGAHGSRWQSEFFLRVDSDVSVFFFPLESLCRITCEVVGPLIGGYAPPRETWRAPLVPYSRNPGYLLRFDSAQASSVSFSLRVRDISRSSQNWGTELPVVRDSDLFSGRLHLLDVPFDARFRQTLRIYDPDASGTSAVRVRVRGSNESGAEALIFDQQVNLTTSEERFPGWNLDLPMHPGYAQLDLGSVIAGLANWQTGRIEIESLTPGLRYWAFVSVTNNDTQHVTVVTPRSAN